MEQNSLLTVLVVEDDRCTRALLAMILERQGYQIITAEDGMAGLAAFEQRRPDVIITDIKMPFMDGLELIRHIRAMVGMAARTPIIALSASTEDLLDAAYQAGADKVGRKPSDVRRVSDLISEVFQAQYAKRAING
jgi:CheY-like chemotaxis protein